MSKYLTLWPLTGPTGTAYKPTWVFNLRLRGHIQREYGTGFSASPVLCNHPTRLLVLYTVFCIYKVRQFFAVYLLLQEIWG